MSESNDLIMGGGGGYPALSLKTVGEKVKFRITKIGKQVQAKEPSGPRKGQPKVWPSGDPVMQVPIELKTDQRDPLDPEDEGFRTWWVRQSSDPQRALRDAIQAAGATAAEVGGTGEIELTGLDDVNFSIPKKLHRVTYVAPGAAAANDVVMGGNPVRSEAPTQATGAVDVNNLTPEMLALLKQVQGGQTDGPPF